MRRRISEVHKEWVLRLILCMVFQVLDGSLAEGIGDVIILLRRLNMLIVFVEWSGGKIVTTSPGTIGV